MTVDAPDVISDYSVQISWCFPLSIVIKRDVRGWSKVNEDSCRAALLESELCTWAPRNLSRALLLTLRQSAVNVSRPVRASQDSDIASSATSTVDVWWMSHAATQEVTDAWAMLKAVKAIEWSSSFGKSWKTTSPGLPKERDIVLVVTNMWTGWPALALSQHVASSGSSEHDFDDDPTTTDLTSLAVQSWNWSKISVAGGSSVVTMPPTWCCLPHCLCRLEEVGELLSWRAILRQSVLSTCRESAVPIGQTVIEIS